MQEPYRCYVFSGNNYR